MKFLAFIAGAALGVTATPAFAVPTYTSLSAWQAAVGSYIADSSYGDEFDDVASVSLDGGATLAFSGALNVRQIGSSWGSWSGGYNGQVLYSNGITSLSATLSPTQGFGFFIEPDPFDVYDFTLLLSDGSTVSSSYDGSAGAGFLGFTGTDITGFTISSDVDFALGNFVVAGRDTAPGVPEAATWAMMVGGFGMVGGALRGRRKTEISFG